MLVINIKFSATYFASMNHHQPKYKYNTGTFCECAIMVFHIVYTRNKMCPITECTSTVFIWNDDGSMSRNM